MERSVNFAKRVSAVSALCAAAANTGQLLAAVQEKPSPAPAKTPSVATQQPVKYEPFRPQGVPVAFTVTAGEIRFEAGKAVSSDATVVKFAVADTNIELVSPKVVTEGKNFIINTKKYGKMLVVFDDNFGATAWVTPSQRRELLKLTK
jgi:hypothetical protein